MSQIKLQAARELIQEQNYKLARSLLLTMDADPTAQKWLEKLEKISPTPIPSPVFAPLPRPRKKSGRKGLIIMLFIVGVVVAGFLLVRQLRLNEWNAKRPEANAALSVFCTLRMARMDDIACDQWVTRLLNEDISKVDAILTCDRLYNHDSAAITSDIDARLFLRCLSNKGIYLPQSF